MKLNHLNLSVLDVAVAAKFFEVFLTSDVQNGKAKMFSSSSLTREDFR